MLIFVIILIYSIKATPYILFITRNTYQGNITSAGSITACQNDAEFYGFVDKTKTAPVLPISTGSCTAGGFCYGTTPPDKSRNVIGLNGLSIGNYSTFTCDGPTAFINSPPYCPNFTNSLSDVVGGCTYFWGFGTVAFSSSLEHFGTTTGGNFATCGNSYWTSSLNTRLGFVGTCSATDTTRLFFDETSSCDSYLPLLCFYYGTTNAPTRTPTTSLPSKTPTTSLPSKTPTTLIPSKTPTKVPTKVPTTKTPTKKSDAVSHNSVKVCVFLFLLFSIFC